MNSIINTLILTLFVCFSSVAQKEKLYDVNAVPETQIKEALQKAKDTNKHVLIQMGGNWCAWCYRFHEFYKNDSELDSIIKADYELININYNPNDLFFLKKLDYPHRFGFPVVIITDSTGKRLHTQNTWYLEDGKGSYDKEKFKDFLLNWNIKSLNPESYKK
jgi:thioredoxin-related protein